MVETVTFDQMSLHCDPELEDSKQIFCNDTLAHDVARVIANKSFCRIHGLMMMNHNTKFENNFFYGLEGIIWTNIKF